MYPNISVRYAVILTKNLLSMLLFLLTAGTFPSILLKFSPAKEFFFTLDTLVLNIVIVF